jgi:hypothetical protein
MKFFLIFLFLLPAPIANASYRTHSKFKAANVGAEVKKIIASFSDDPKLKGISVFSTRTIQPSKHTGQGVRIKRKENGSFDLTFQIAKEQLDEGYVAADFETKREFHLFSFHSLKNPKEKWHLDPILELKLAREVTNHSPMAGFTMKIRNKTVFELKTSRALKSIKEAKVNVWQEEAVIQLIELYFSKNPRHQELWEDD